MKHLKWIFLLPSFLFTTTAFCAGSIESEVLREKYNIGVTGIRKDQENVHSFKKQADGSGLMTSNGNMLPAVRGVSKEFPYKELKWTSEYYGIHLQYDGLTLHVVQKIADQGQSVQIVDSGVHISSDGKNIIVTYEVYSRPKQEGEILRREAIVVRTKELIEDIDRLAKAKPYFSAKEYNFPDTSRVMVWSAADAETLKKPSIVVTTLVPNNRIVTDYSPTGHMVLSKIKFSSDSYTFIDGPRGVRTYLQEANIAKPYQNSSAKLWQFWPSYTEESWKPLMKSVDVNLCSRLLL